MLVLFMFQILRNKLSNEFYLMLYNGAYLQSFSYSRLGVQIASAMFYLEFRDLSFIVKLYDFLWISNTFLHSKLS